MDKEKISITDLMEKYTTDWVDSLRAIKSDLEKNSIKFGHKDNKTYIVDEIIYDDYKELPGPVAVEVKQIYQMYSLKQRLDETLYKLLEITDVIEVRSVIFVIYDAIGNVNWEEIKELESQLDKRFKIKFFDHEEIVGKKIPRDLLKNVFNEFSDPSAGYMAENYLYNLIDKSSDTYLGKKAKEIIITTDNKNVVFCLGAGVSRSANVPDWNELIDKLWLREVTGRISFSDLDEKKLSEIVNEIVGSSPLIRARMLDVFTKAGLIDRIREEIYKNNPFGSDLIESICKFIKVRLFKKKSINIITFNYDDLMESNLEKMGIKTNSSYPNSEVTSTEKFNVFHVHGYLPPTPQEIDKNMRESIVFSENSYHSQYFDPYSWSNLVMYNSFVKDTCIFLGCSMTDPNLRRLLEISQEKSKGVRHICVLKSAKYKKENPEIDFATAMIKGAQSKSLIKLGVSIVWVDDYSEIPNLLDKITLHEAETE
jgi:NAD-dependent SIR2 family protein deacetylase